MQSLFSRFFLLPKRSTFRLSTAALLLSLPLTLCISRPLHADERHVEHRVPPVYPELAKRMKISGIVRLNVTVAADGSVVKALAVSGNKMLTAAAEDAVKRWKFAPGSSESTTEVDINFQAQ